ncbi:METTL21A [Branchiostoma lanceolatum]|uniref:METTL21A protein n=1 Tax=Branchiostoma lanceolatum TaxID=7740 RepID=A0A8J9ZI68_BRALA|nr:METTL21A [Branchiostoma lanceolatum]
MAASLGKLFCREVKLEDESVLKVQQCEIGDVGCVVWDAALVLAKFLELAAGKSANNSQQPATSKFCDVTLQNKTVVELGAGTGIVGIMAGILGADVRITDLQQFVPLMELNIKENAERIKGSVKASTLKWGEDITPFLPHPDYIIFSDCIYYEESLQPLIETISALAGNHTVVLWSYEERAMGHKQKKKPRLQQRFFEAITKDFTVEEVPQDSLHAVYRSEDIHVLRMERKSQNNDQKHLRLEHATSATFKYGMTYETKHTISDVPDH